MEALVKVTSARKTKEDKNNSPASAKPPAGITNAQAAIVVLIGIAFSLGVIFEWEPLNGVKTWAHWEWPWRDLGVFETGMWMLPSILAIGWVLWRVEKRASPQPWQLLPLLVLSNYALQVLGMLADPRGIKFVGTIVASAGATSILQMRSQFRGALQTGCGISIRHSSIGIRRLIRRGLSSSIILFLSYLAGTQAHLWEAVV